VCMPWFHLLSICGFWTDLSDSRIIRDFAVDLKNRKFGSANEEIDGDRGAIIFGRLFRLHEDCGVVNKHRGMQGGDDHDGRTEGGA